MNPVLVAHGTRRAEGVAMVADLADRVGRQLGTRVRTAFVDVLGPSQRVVGVVLDRSLAA